MMVSLSIQTKFVSRRLCPQARGLEAVLPLILKKKAKTATGDDRTQFFAGKALHLHLLLCVNHHIPFRIYALMLFFQACELAPWQLKLFEGTGRLQPLCKQHWNQSAQGNVVIEHILH